MIRIAVFGSSATPQGSAEWADAERLGGEIAARGWVVATGGYGGTMEAVSRGAAHAGGHVIGVTAPSVFPDRGGANPHVAEEIAAGSLLTRIATLVESTDAAVVLPGSIGTLTELVVAWNEAFVAPFRGVTPKPVIAVGAGWAEIVGLLCDRLPTGEGFVHVVDRPEEALEAIQRWIRRSGDEDR